MGYPTEDDHEYGGRYRKAWNERHDCWNTEMEEVCDEMYKVGTWVGEDDRKSLIHPHLDIATEVVVGEDEERIFDKEENPDEFEYGPYTGNEGPSLEYFYHKASIVLWPKKKTVPTMFEAVAGKYHSFDSDDEEELRSLLRARRELRVCSEPVFFHPGYCAVVSVLRILKHMQRENHPYVHLMLSQLLTHCESQGQIIWLSPGSLDPKVEGMDGSITSILLNMCLAEGGLLDVLRVLKLLRKRFREDVSGSINRKQWCVGIRNASVAKAIANAVRCHGWTACSAAVLELLQKDYVIQQGDNFAQLAVELRQIGCHREAITVATKTFDLVTSSNCSPEILRGSIQANPVLGVAKMLWTFGDSLEELGSKFVRWIGEIDIATIVKVLNEMFDVMYQESTAKDGKLKSYVLVGNEDSAIFRRFLQACEMATQRDFYLASRYGAFEGELESLVYNFIRLGDKDLLDKLMHALVGQARKHKLYHWIPYKLFQSDIFWKEILTVDMGRYTLQALVEALDTESLCLSVNTRIHKYRNPGQCLMFFDGDYDKSLMRAILLELCELLVLRDFHNPVEVNSDLVIDLVRNFFLLGDEGLFQGLVQSLLQEAILHKQQHLVKELLRADSLRSVLVESALGRDALIALSQERMKWLVLSDQKPEFSWCQPFARLQDHPTVEEFLRGPKESFTYTNFNGLPDARKFAHQYFNGYYTNGYCATGTEGGRGAAAYCAIQKSPTAFQYVLENWKEERKEVETLKLQIEELRKWSDGGAGREKKKSAGPDATEDQRFLQACPDPAVHPDKKRKQQKDFSRSWIT